GLYLRTRELTREGTQVRVALALPYLDGPRYCTLVGRIARVDRDGHGSTRGVGVRFLSEEMGAVDRATLNTFLSFRRMAATA
ncbi:MAG: PilZ domain-containing protein, partial [Myxococcaceae bacterium]